MMPGDRQQGSAPVAPRPLTLTFDNGPTPGITERVLDVLARHGLQATFFVIGKQLRNQAAAALLPKIELAGHRIGNHTLNHQVALGDRPDAAYAWAEIDEAQALIGTFAGAEKLFRPYGNDGLLGPHLFSKAALSHLRDNDYTSVLWNLVPGDWRNPDGWDADCDAALASLDWPVIVLHDIESGCLARLPSFLTRIADLGYAVEQEFPDSVVVTRAKRFVTLTDSVVADGMPT
jgi:peptidoglycan/xylan/chitin deacetylase (PgdA/CDA1 family)